MDDCCFKVTSALLVTSWTLHPQLIWQILHDWAADWFIGNKMINVGLFLKRLPAALHHNRLIPVHMLVLISLKDKSECFVLVFFFLNSHKGINLYIVFSLHSCHQSCGMLRVSDWISIDCPEGLSGAAYITAAKSVTSVRQIRNMCVKPFGILWFSAFIGDKMLSAHRCWHIYIVP